MATIKVYKGKRKTSYQLTIFKGYTEKDGKKVQARETVTYSLEEMGINPLTDKGNPKSESTILKDVQLYADNLVSCLDINIRYIISRFINALLYRCFINFCINVALF